MAAPPPPPEEPTVVEEVDEGPPGRRVVVDERPPRDIWGWLVAALTAAAAILFLVLWLNERGPDTRAVPGLVGLSQARAEREAASRGFRLALIRRTSDRPEGAVLDQAPGIGAELERGARIVAIVSSGRRRIAVPQLVGLQRPAARRLAQTAQLTLREQVVPSDEPEGAIVAQNPSAGERVALGTDVFVSVSRGPQLVAVPALRGLTLDRASEALARVGLVPTVVRVPAAAREDTVIAQDPPRGQEVRRGTRVRVNVSTGAAAPQTETLTVTVTVTNETTVTVEEPPPETP